MSACVEDPGRLRDLADRIRAGNLSPVELVQRYLDRIEVVQPLAAPWREIDAERAHVVAKAREEQAARGEILGPLHGIPFGVKDIIDVEGLPTRCNCRAFEDRAPAAADAEVVLALKAAGAIVLGKVHTTEFAFFEPSPARNPHNTAHTPGGSSSGSGAAVASGTVPMALGTQTMASLNRPAAYCGIAAFKPSTRSVSGYGVSPLAPSFDTTGIYGWTVDDAVYGYEALMPPGTAPIGSTPSLEKARVVVIEDPLIEDMSPDMKAAFEAKCEAVRAPEREVVSLPSPVPFMRLGELHWSIMAYETGRTLAHMLDYPAELVGVRIRELIAEGRAISSERYVRDRAELNALRRAFFGAFATTDVFLWPATPGPAPESIASTGNPKYIAPWTVLGGPIVTLPAGFSNGLPIGCILSSVPGSDHALGTLARSFSV
jgi:aspartyl-tRNA(Asn)/glutamyl-tRNA(Gln) amidotransferase subunit A